MSKIKTINVGKRTIDLHAFTGQVVHKDTSTYTESRLHGNNQISTRTDTYSNLFIRSQDGEERQLQVANMNIGIRPDNKVSLLWGIKSGKEKGDYIAVYNHDTKAIHHIRKGNNDLAGPVGYNMMMIVAVIVGMIGLYNVMMGDMSSLFFIAIGAGAIYWIYKRQKKLMAEANMALTAL